MSNILIVGAAVEDKYISAGIIDFTDRIVTGNSLRRKRVDPKGSANDIIEKWAECIKEVIETRDPSTIRLGIGIPNLIDYEAGIYLDNDPTRYGSLCNKNIKALLGEKLGIPFQNIRISNVDANLLQGEVFAGAARGYKRSFGITLGVGLGTARFVNNEVQDANFWKLPFKGSIAEEYLSLRYLLKRFAELSGIEVEDLMEMKRYYPHAAVEQAFNEFGTSLGEFIEWIIQTEKPEIVLIGGQMESSYRYFFETATNYLKAKGIRTPIIKAILGEKAYVIGGGATWSDLVLPGQAQFA